VQYLAVSHKGVMLVRREKSLPTDYLKVTLQHKAGLWVPSIEIVDNLENILYPKHRDSRYSREHTVPPKHRDSR
jgi:hypothetical protein